MGASSCQVSSRWQGHQVKCTRLFWRLTPGFCWLCSSCCGILQTCLMGCQLSASPASATFIPHEIGATSSRNYNVEAFREFSTKTPVRGYSWFWSIPVSQKLVWVYTVPNKTLNILPLGLLCQKQTQMWTLLSISAFLLTVHVLGSLSAAVTSSQWTPSHCLWEKRSCNKLGSHWSHGIISSFYNIIPSELFPQVSWTVSVHFAILILFSKSRQCAI